MEKLLVTVLMLPALAALVPLSANLSDTCASM
jgi:hypothetical protein